MEGSYILRDIYRACIQHDHHNIIILVIVNTTMPDECWNVSESHYKDLCTWRSTFDVNSAKYYEITFIQLWGMHIVLKCRKKVVRIKYIIYVTSIAMKGIMVYHEIIVTLNGPR